MDTEILSEIEKYIEEMGNLIHISHSLSDLVIPKSENLLRSIYSTKIRDLKGVRRSLMMLRRDFIADGEFSQRCMDRNAEISKRRKKNREEIPVH